MTIYITYIRAKAVSNVANATECQNKTTKRIVIELICYVTLLFVISFSLALVVDFNIVSFTYYSVTAILMAILASSTLR